MPRLRLLAACSIALLAFWAYREIDDTREIGHVSTDPSLAREIVGPPRSDFEPITLPYLDDIPLFVPTPPDGDIGSTAVLKIRVLHFLNADQCTHARPTLDPRIISERSATSFAYAEVLDVVKGSFPWKTALVCGVQSSDVFFIGETGLIWGRVSKNAQGDAAFFPFETRGKRWLRRVSEIFVNARSAFTGWIS